MPVDDLVDYLQYRADDALRVISWYSDDDWGTLYVRDDLDRVEVEERIDFVATKLSTPGRNREEHPLAPLGEEQAMVQVRENAVIIRFSMEEEGGILVSLDTEVARDLHGFVVECSEKLQGAELRFAASEI